jgi:uncharacterized membrane protein
MAAAVRGSAARPLAWLRAGWADLRVSAPACLAFSLLFVAGALLIVAVGWRDAGLLAGAFSGFVLVAPVLVAGFHELSRRRMRGESLGPAALVAVWRRCTGRLIRFGALLALIGTAWVGFSVALVRLLGQPGQAGVAGFLERFVAPDNGILFIVWWLSGGLVAAVVFAISVIAVPMLVDRELPVGEAIRQSVATVGRYPVTMASWAVIVMGLTLVGMISIAGLVLVLPLLGHASWHAYRDLVGADQIADDSER